MGHPYHVVHFDGHGSFTDNVLLSSESKVKRGYVLFENPDSYDCPIYVDGECFAKLLKQAGVPWLILNACESAQIQPPRPKYLLIDWFQQSNEESRVKSFDLEAMENGLIGVVAMRNKITVVAAQIFFKEFYNALARGALISEAAARGRRVLARTHDRRPACTLFDWTIPVVYESKPFSMFNNREEWFLYEKNAPNDIEDP
jgi:CHAT domain